MARIRVGDVEFYFSPIWHGLGHERLDPHKIGYGVSWDWRLRLGFVDVLHRRWFLCLMPECKHYNAGNCSYELGVMIMREGDGAVCATYYPREDRPCTASES